MSLGVYWHRDEIGKLQRIDELSREYYFQYTNPSQAISLSLPISEEPFTPEQTRPFFEALLPEGAVRERIAGQFKLAASDSYSLCQCSAATARVHFRSSPLSACQRHPRFAGSTRTSSTY